MNWKKFVGEWFNSKYLLQAFLGFGAYGAVFQADEVVADRKIQSVAIKIIPYDSHNLDQQIKELQLGVKLKNPHLINCYTCEQGELDGDLYLGLVMELADYSLESYLKAEDKTCLSLEEVRDLVEQLAKGLDFIHEQGIVHRDLKPGNILRVGRSWKLADFGISRLLNNATSTYTNASKQIGTIGYIPPESYDGNISPAWDLWYLGIMIVELLTGNHPFSAKTIPELMKKVLIDQPILPEDLGSPFQEIVTGCLIKDRNQRWTTQTILSILNTSAPSFSNSPINSSSSVSISQFSTSQTITEILGGGIILEMVKIPAGSFLMGIEETEVIRLCQEESTDWYKCTLPQHRVSLHEYYLSKYTITQEVWQVVMGYNPSFFKDNPKNPVEQVNWYQTQEFCQNLSQITKKQYRLPSEAEWEYACLAGSTTPFHFGNTMSTEQANFNSRMNIIGFTNKLYRKKTLVSLFIRAGRKGYEKV